MNAAHCGVAQTGIALAAAFLYPATLHQVFVELLQITRCQLVELDLSDPWNGVTLDDQLVAVCGSRPDIGLGVELVPAAKPGSHCIVLTSAHIQTSALLLSLGQLLLYLGLGLAEDILDDPLAGFKIAAGGVPSLPSLTPEE